MQQQKKGVEHAHRAEDVRVERLPHQVGGHVGGADHGVAVTAFFDRGIVDQYVEPPIRLDRLRGGMLDEALAILPTAWSGRPVRHRGRHYTVDYITFLPRPVQPTIPIWIAGFLGNVVPLRRAARFHGYFPVNLDSPEQVADAVGVLGALRENRTPTRPFDVAVACAPSADVAAYAEAGATWWLTDFEPEALTISHIRAVIDDGPVGY